jgi:hypothetical protein
MNNTNKVLCLNTLSTTHTDLPSNGYVAWVYCPVPLGGESQDILTFWIDCYCFGNAWKESPWEYTTSGLEHAKTCERLEKV